MFIMGNKSTYEDVRKFIKNKGGELLSPEYINATTKLKIKCKHNHIFYITFNKIKSAGRWCRYCNIEKRKYSYKYVNDIVESKNGILLSTEYINNSNSLKISCKKCNKIWFPTFSSILRNHWCPCCMKNRVSLNDAQNLAKSNNGYLLSNEFNNTSTKYKWMCIKGHTWHTTFDSIKRGTWCPKCAGKAKLTLEDAQNLAKSRKGKFLSNIIKNNSTKYKWQCEKNHIWEANYGNIQNGRWCPHCSKHVRITLKQAKKLAKSKNGKFLSNEFNGSNIKYKWTCNKSHIWESTYSNIKSGKWCPYCAKLKKLTFEEVKKQIEEKDGSLLSTEYINAHKKLKLQCEYGHKWEMNWNKIQSERWCPYCINKTEQRCRKILKKLLQKDFNIVWPEWLKNPRTNARMQLDGYCPELNLAFEYNGPQHYILHKHNDYNEEKLKKIKFRDRIKNKICKQKGIKLINIKYTVNNLEEYIRKKLKCLQIL